MDLLIVGAGEMGRWLARVVNDSFSITFTDVDERVARRAADELDAQTISLDEDCRFDAVCFAVPMSAIETSVAEHAPRARKAVFDVAGFMTTPLQSMAEHAPDLERASFHPLFASENAPGNVAVVVANRGPVVESVLSQISQADNTVIETTPREHDDSMKSVQAKAHAAILSFALASETVPDGLRTPVYDGLQALVEQVTGGAPHVYGEIQQEFDGAVDVATAAERIATADEETFAQLYEDAGGTQ